MGKKNSNSLLSEIIDLKKIEAVNNPIEQAQGLPNECYTSNEYQIFERDKIFSDKWVVIGVGSSIPNIGDANPYDLLGIPLIMIRGKDKKIRVFHNVCSHRGLKLLNEPCHLKNVLRCPYHSWSYDLEGSLVATPHIGGLNIHQIDSFDRKKSNLKEVKSKIWMDMIFVNLNKNEIEFDEYIKPLESRWSKFISKEDQNLIRHAKDYGYINLEINSNWKFAIENFCESYHLPFIHPELNKKSNISDHYHIQGLPNRFAGQGSHKYNQIMKGNKKFNSFPLWPQDLALNAEYIALFPNVMIGLHIDHFYIFWLEPISINKTKEHIEIYYIGKESAESKEFKEMRKENLNFWREVMTEDISVVEGMQDGRASPAYNGGNFSPIMDYPTLQFHKWIATNLVA
tara:strand:- start:845 stop:2041 length:1197 start_codon:yes stop_codon:yes gene_type:complete